MAICPQTHRSIEMYNLTRLGTLQRRLARQFSTQRLYDVVIVGGGAAGINVASQLGNNNLKVAVIEPSAVHHNEDAWNEAAFGKTNANYVDFESGTPGSMVGKLIHDAGAPDLLMQMEPERLVKAAKLYEKPNWPAGLTKEEFEDALSWLGNWTKPRVPIAALDTKILIAKTGAEWIVDKVTSFKPEENKVVTNSGAVSYKQLVVATGTDFNFDAIKGFKSALEDRNSGVVTWAHPSHCISVAQNLWAFEGGKFILTKPKMDYVPAELLTKELYDWLAFEGIRSVQYYNFTAEERVEQDFGYGINDCPGLELVEIRAKSKEAVFEYLQGSRKGQKRVEKYDLIHVTPRSDPVPEVKASPLSDSTGFVDVDMCTMQSVKFKNVWSLGSASNLPMSKDTVAIAYQSAFLVENLNACLDGKEPTAEFDGGHWYGTDRTVLGKGEMYEALLNGATWTHIQAHDTEALNAEMDSYAHYEGLWKRLESKFPAATVGH
eukprot:gb/GEZN01007111.1/.p1 GENE.gb/GEZN01007111.1/~~gb/GEZN01007111.1/.p1  ORF type:complete len:491 (+),score=54.07 gb/GEZN01007111.1/:31-1503(+)